MAGASFARIPAFQTLSGACEFVVVTRRLAVRSGRSESRTVKAGRRPPLKHVLLASDLSARSERACSRAALLARKHKARLTALHIVDDELPATVAKRQELDAQDALRRTLAALPPAAEFDLNIDVRPGQYEEAIIDRAEQLDADLVVI